MGLPLSGAGACQVLLTGLGAVMPNSWQDVREEQAQRRRERDGGPQGADAVSAGLDGHIFRQLNQTIN
jgi:hypothetical protein